MNIDNKHKHYITKYLQRYITFYLIRQSHNHTEKKWEAKSVIISFINIGRLDMNPKCATILVKNITNSFPIGIVI